MVQVAPGQRLWLNRCDNPSDGIALPMLWGSAIAWPTADGANRRYANGALRTVVAGDERGPFILDSWTPALGVITAAQALDLRRRVGVPHFARDPIGQRIPCVFWSAEPTLGGPARGATVSATVVLMLERTDYYETV